MAHKLTDTNAKTLPAPPTGAKIYFIDSDVKGLGMRVTANGARAFVLNYRTKAGRERRYTIGSFPDWKVGAARDEARNLKKAIDRGEDPMADLHAGRGAPTVCQMCDRFKQDELPRKRAATKVEYERLIDLDIRPVLGTMKVAEIVFADVDSLHRKITKRGAPYVANRQVAILSRMFSLAVKWGWRPDNPARGIERNQEVKRTRFLTGAELAALSTALAGHKDKQAADIIRLMLFSGCRRGEALGAQWRQFDLETGMWTKPSSLTKQQREHRVPIAAPARELLGELKAKAPADAVFVFPSDSAHGHRHTISKTWDDIRTAAGISNVRLHDLRHHFASVLAGAGLSLPIIGALLGHSQAQTTQRYAHLMDDPLRKAVETVGAIIGGRSSGKIIKLRKGDPS